MGVLGEGASNDSGVIENVDTVVFSGGRVTSSEHWEIRVTYIVLLSSLSSFHETRDLEWPFCVKFCFALARLEL